LKSIQTQILAQPSEENGHRCIVKAVVEVEKGHFEGIGDADPGNVEGFLAPHLIRVAETRAKARALRDAVNCGIVSFEELDGVNRGPDPNPGPGAQPKPSNGRSPRHATNGAGRSRTATPNAQRPATARSGNGASESMTEAQRRYLFRILAGQGLHKEGAEEHLKDLFQVDSLSAVTKFAATKMIDQLLNPAPAGASRGGSADF